PLLADAHINGTDPLRCILYRFLPFELAYNWTLIGHCLLSGIAMLLLLRHFGFADWQCALLAITYQFSTSLVLHFATWVDAGFGLAGPVILGQLELFFLSIRKIHTPFNPREVLAPLGSLSAVYPWALGTFRTLDLSKIAAQRYHFGFVLYIGSAAICLALLGAMDRLRDSVFRLQRPRRTAF